MLVCSLHKSLKLRKHKRQKILLTSDFTVFIVLKIVMIRCWYAKNCVKLQQSAEDAEAKHIYEMEKPLSERLKVARTDAFDPLPPQLLRKVGITMQLCNDCSFLAVISLLFLIPVLSHYVTLLHVSFLAKKIAWSTNLLHRRLFW